MPDRNELSLSQLVAHVRTEQRARWMRGDRISVEELFETHPRLRADTERAIDLIYSEFCLREELDDAPSPADYLRSYPEFQTELEPLFELHEVLSDERNVADSRLADPSVETPAIKNSATIPAVEQHPSASDETSHLKHETLPPAKSPPRNADSETGPVRPDNLPQRFGDYELLQEIARGGMGVVYRARQIKLNRIVALKMILTGQLASEQDIQRFYTEAEAAAGLDHPGIVPIYEVGEQDGRHFFSMGFIEGGSLSDRVQDGPLPPGEAAELTLKTAQAIAFAHQQGVIHRDLKPANVLLDPDGEPHITDFGLAKKIERNSSLTGSGQILGTPGYMPPEQATGDAERIGPVSDVYSVGAILYCLLTGRPPFQSANVMDTLLQVIEQEPIPPRQLNGVVDLDLETICLKSLEKDQYRRYQTAGDLAAELQRYLNDEPIVARPVGRIERARRWCRRKPTLAALCATALVLLLVLSVGGPWVAFRQSEYAAAQRNNATAQSALRAKADGQAKRADREAAAARASAAKAIDAQARADRQRAEALRRVYIADIQRASFELEQGNLYEAQLALERHHPEPDAEDLRGWEWYYLRARCGRESMTLREHSSIVDAIAWSPRVDRLASLSSHAGRLLVYDVDQSLVLFDQNVADLRASSLTPLLQWSADGDSLMALYTSKVQVRSKAQVRCKVWDVETGHLLLSNIDDLLCAAWSPLKPELALLFRDGTVKAWPVDGSEETEIGRLANKTPPLGVRMQWSPDGQYIAVEHTQSTEIISVKLGQSICQFPRTHMSRTRTSLSSSGIAWSPDSGHLVTVASPQHLAVIDVNKPEEPKLVSLLTNNHLIGINPCLSWSRQDDRLALCTSQAVVVFNDVVKSAKPLPLIYMTERSLTNITWHNDAAHLLAFDQAGCIETWNNRAGVQKSVDRFGAHTAEIHGAEWNHNRTRFATSGSDTVIRIWDANTLVAPDCFPTHGPLEWHPSQNRLYSRFGVIDVSTMESTRWSLDDPHPQGPQQCVKAWTDWHNAEATTGHSGIDGRRWNATAGEFMVTGTLSSREKVVDGKWKLVAMPQRFVMRWSPESNIRQLVYSMIYRRYQKRPFLTLGENGLFIAIEQNDLVRFDADGKEQCRVAVNGDGIRLLQTTHDCGSAILLRQRETESLLECWNLDTGKNWTRTLPHRSTTAAVSRDSTLLVYDQVDQVNGVIRLVLCDVKDGQVLSEVAAHALLPTNGEPAGCSLLTFGRDRLVSSSGQELKVWDTAELQEFLRIRLKTPGPVSCGAFSPDQKMLAIGVGVRLVLLDATPGYRMSQPLHEDFFIRKVPQVGGGFF